MAAFQVALGILHGPLDGDMVASSVEVEPTGAISSGETRSSPSAWKFLLSSRLVRRFADGFLHRSDFFFYLFFVFSSSRAGECPPPLGADDWRTELISESERDGKLGETLLSVGQKLCAESSAGPLGNLGRDQPRPFPVGPRVFRPAAQEWADGV